MEYNEEFYEEELSETIEHLIKLGALEIFGYDSISDTFTYQITPQCKEMYPEFYYSHYEALGEIAKGLWMQDIVEVDFTEGETSVSVTLEQIDYIQENILTFTDDERFFLEAILSRYNQK